MLFKAMGKRHSMAAGIGSMLLIGASYAGSRTATEIQGPMPTATVDVETVFDCEAGPSAEHAELSGSSERST